MGAETWSEKTRRHMELIGWFPGRRRDDLVTAWSERLRDESGFALSPAAAEALAEFGYLGSSLSGPGLECATTPFVIDPSGAVGEEDLFARFGSLIGQTLYPIGQVEDRTAFLAIDPKGHVYSAGDHLGLIAEDIYLALDALIVGRLHKTLVPA